MEYCNISLIGFMASGKSTVGKLIADKMQMVFIDTDRVIELKQGMPVADIFKNFGEIYFRDQESEVIAKLGDNKDCVFACGGGVVERGENIRVLKKNSLVVYLKASPLKVLERTEGVSGRPLLDVPDKKQKIMDLMQRRDQTYRSSADVIIDTDIYEPYQIADIIISIFEKK
ncbi:MAG: shikimate kinase [Actinomycetia bacterium]|nr:shikimate kinase [Actinomycetes bacterium]